MLQLPQPTVIGAVTPSPCRAPGPRFKSDRPHPTPRVSTTQRALPGPPPLKQGDNTIRFPPRRRPPNLLVWISTLGTTDGESRTELSKITVQAAS